MFELTTFFSKENCFKHQHSPIPPLRLLLDFSLNKQIKQGNTRETCFRNLVQNKLASQNHLTKTENGKKTPFTEFFTFTFTYDPVCS